MPTDVHEAAYRRALDLCAAARMFTLPQVARLPDLAWRGSPSKRAWDALEPHRDKFEVAIRAPGKPAIWRLTYQAKKEHGLKYQSINPQSQKADHWLRIGDLWLAMTQAGGRPQVWNSQPDSIGFFDVYAVWQGAEFYIEVQKSRLSPRRWSQKWETRFKWLDKKPGYVVCIDYSGSGKNYKGVRYFDNEHVFVSSVNKAVMKRQAP